MRGDDMVPFLLPPDGDGLGFRQGVVVEWNPDTAKNKIAVAGAVVEDLPIFNTSEALLITPGAVVGILTAGRTWFVLGRITIPGTPEAASALQMITTATDAVSSFIRVTSTYPDYVSAPDGLGPTVPVRIGPNRRALIILSAQMQFASDVGAAPPQYRNGRVGYRITQVSTGTVTAPPSDDRKLLMQTNGQENTLFAASLVSVASGFMFPAAGEYTVEMMYSALNLGGADAAGQIAFSSRMLAVIPL
ncbi:hypothetical protein [Micromonospora craterilacus]|nr:hypothetical protein [Micromonospora craterilacus]